jgi:hypothetical protein
MLSIFIDNKYTAWYYKIISNAQNNGRIGYTESHHIIPKSFFKKRSLSGWLDENPDNPDNIVNLTAKEHFVCHLLLTKMTQGLAYKKSVYAAKRCRYGKPGTPQYVPSGRVYQIIKEQWSLINPFNDVKWQQQQATNKRGKSFTEEHKNNLKKSWTTERKKLMSDRNKGICLNKTTNKGKKMPQLSGANNGFYGKTHSVETVEKIKTRLKGKPTPWAQKYLICTHCGKKMDLGNFTRYHGDRCKLKN